ncbi:hypothetical protein [Leptolyngbya sp. BC1307]|uniref:hypothetical protein n=1 Tax=Leptolyngbya sp. BC1307 TaxID=2029589 RepID=UPI000EFA8E45|nr:hypothetical protein [Leptolyngbya sp. BC1307]
MTQPARDTFGQARQGSVAAIIHILNDRLISTGIRTRAVVSDGMLQILCEAATVEQLEKDPLIEQVRHTLETISPQRIKKVKINSRIVKEDQLLWIEEINRDPAKALLWSEVIVLKRPFFIERWIRDRNLKPAGPVFKDIREPEPSKFALPLRIFGGIGLLLLLLAAGWFLHRDLGGANADPVVVVPASPESRVEPAGADDLDDAAADTVSQASDEDAFNNADPSDADLSDADSSDSEVVAEEADSPAPDAFAEAVRIAEQAAIEGQRATTANDWLDLAARWQQASDLMSEIPESSAEYDIAQDRIQTYQTNSQAALRQATAAQER